MTQKRTWPRNLNDAVRMYGTGSHTRPVVKWLKECLQKQQDASQAARLEERGTLEKQNPYCTDAGKECDRQVYFSFTNEPATDPFDTASLIKFAFGHAAEEALAAIAAHGDAEIHREVRVEIPVDGTKVSGRIDFLIVSEGRIIELKSTSSKAMSAMLWKAEAGKESNRRQLNLYLHASQLGLLDVGAGTVSPDGEGSPPRRPAPLFSLGELVYIVTDATKGTDNIHAFPVEYDKERAERDLEHLAHLWSAAQQDSDPGIPNDYLAQFSKDNKPPLWPCAYCQYNKRCWSEVRKARAA